MKQLLLPLAILLCLVTGCGSQPLRVESLQEILRQETLRFSGDQPDKQAASSPARPVAPKLGLYVKPTGFLQHEFEWTDRDRDSILAWAQELSVAQTGFIPLSSLKGNTLVQLRDSAARYGADALVMFEGAAAVDRYNNYKAPLLYWTILGAYFADGTHSDALCLIRGSVWDVKTGTLLFSEEAEGHSQAVGPVAFVDDRTVVLTARQQALAALLAALKERLLRLQHP